MAPFAVRLDRVRALLPEAGPFTQSSIHRRARGRELDEPLGGMRTPLVVLDGRGSLVVSAEPDLWSHASSASCSTRVKTA